MSLPDRLLRGSFPCPLIVWHSRQGLFGKPLPHSRHRGKGWPGSCRWFSALLPGCRWHFSSIMMIELPIRSSACIISLPAGPGIANRSWAPKANLYNSIALRASLNINIVLRCDNLLGSPLSYHSSLSEEKPNGSTFFIL